MLPVSAGFHPAETSKVTGNHRIMSDKVNPLRIDPDTDHLADPFARGRVAIPVKGNQAGARYLEYRKDYDIDCINQ